MTVSERAPRTRQRQRVFAKRREIVELVQAGWSGRAIRIELGLTDIPESSFYHNLKTLKREAMTASAILAAELERLAGEKVGPAMEPTEAAEKNRPSAPSGTGTEPPPPTVEKRKRRSLKIVKLGKGVDDAPSLDPQKWKKPLNKI